MFIVSAVLTVLGFLQFGERGFLFNNAYIYASEEERKTMNKKPYYKESATIFCILCAIFLVIGLSLVLQNDKLSLLELPLIVGAIIYAIVSTVKINKQMKR